VRANVWDNAFFKNFESAKKKKRILQAKFDKSNDFGEDLTRLNQGIGGAALLCANEIYFGTPTDLEQMEDDLDTLGKCPEDIKNKCSPLTFPTRWDEKQTSEKECHKIKDEFIILLDNAMKRGSAQFLEEATILNEKWSNGMVECKDGTDPDGYDSIRSFTQRMSKRLQNDCKGEIVICGQNTIRVFYLQVSSANAKRLLVDLQSISSSAEIYVVKQELPKTKL
jgi:hypothetical protein